MKFKGRLVPVLGVVGGTKEQSAETAKNIDRYFANAQSFSISPDGKSITCHVCGMTSYHPEDQRNKYCGRCHVFHQDRAGETPAAR